MKMNFNRTMGLDFNSKGFVARSFKVFLLAILPITVISSCEDFIEIEVPRTDLISETVFNNDEAATAAIINIYSQMANDRFASGGSNSATLLMSLSSDELVNVNSGFGANSQERQLFNDNELIPLAEMISTIWSEPYQYIFKANAILEGLQTQSGLSEDVRDQLVGEALFIRAFSHFYLVNLFGDVPLILTTDFQLNTDLPRTLKSQVYEQIVIDLKEAQTLLLDNYSFSMGARIRPNKSVASALLSRTYLYMEDWLNAEAQATTILNNSAYKLVDNLDDVFLTDSEEAIWQLYTEQNTNEAQTFIYSGFTSIATLANEFADSFEVDDKRRLNWVGVAIDGPDTFFYPFKYKTRGPTDPIQEYSMVFRIAEQYLIRAEARAQQNKLIESINDIDAIRNRAGLPLIQQTNPTISQSDLLLAIEQERKFELFTEWGHRWLDLKRTGRADAILSNLKTTWESTDALYPIPEIQIENNPKTSQNPGYQ